MRRAREEKRLSQRRLAALVGVNSETINRVENGHNTRVETMALIQRVLPNLVLHRDPVAAMRSEHEQALEAAQRERDQLAEAHQRLMHIVQAITSMERLQRLQAMALKALTADLNEDDTLVVPFPKPRRRR
jgi:transcriptional regulator with XRE-family HTH domain